MIWFGVLCKTLTLSEKKFQIWKKKTLSVSSRFHSMAKALPFLTVLCFHFHAAEVFRKA